MEEVIQRGKQLPMGQITRRAEYDDGRGIRRSDLGLHASPRRTECPPNSLLRAAMIFAANDSSCLEANRANSERAVIGAGTSRSNAAWTVHRPSPESSTKPLTCSRRGGFVTARGKKARSPQGVTGPPP